MTKMTQLEALKERHARLVARAGPDGPFVKALEQQIRNAEKPQAENPVVNRFHIGKRGQPGRPKE